MYRQLKIINTISHQMCPSDLYKATSVISVGGNGSSFIICLLMAPPRATFITVLILLMTFWLLEDCGDVTFDKQNMTGRGAHGL